VRATIPRVLLVDIGSYKLFPPGWPPTLILPTSASWVARISGGHDQLEKGSLIGGLFTKLLPEGRERSHHVKSRDYTLSSRDVACQR
jgi:hypothetical protein